MGQMDHKAARLGSAGVGYAAPLPSRLSKLRPYVAPFRHKGGEISTGVPVF